MSIDAPQYRRSYTCVAERIDSGSPLARMSDPEFTHVVIRHRPNRDDDLYLYRKSDRFLRKIVTDSLTGMPMATDPNGWVDSRMWRRINGALARLTAEETTDHTPEGRRAA